MIDKSIYIPLFTEMSQSVDSPFFTLVPGEIALLQAFGLAETKARAEGELLEAQMACLDMLLFAEGVVPVREPDFCPTYRLDDYYTKILARETMWKDGCAYALTSCNNIMLLNIPGSYCLQLNDVTALGVARVYMRVFSHEEFPWDSKFFIGD